jgi:hypothetical protein
LYDIAKSHYFSWHDNGRLRNGLIYEEMKRSKSAFRKALADCRRNVESIRNYKLGQSFANKNKSQFWKEIRKLNPKKAESSSRMDGYTKQTDVLKVFNDKFKNIFVDNGSNTKPVNFDENMRNMRIAASLSNYKILELDVKKAIGLLNNCLGFDGLHSNHFKLCNSTLFIHFISKLFSSFMSHGFVPKLMLQGEIRPIIKDHLNPADDSNNYRPITISSNCLRIIEYCILGHLQYKLNLNMRQFGFRKHTSTIMAVTMLKETIHSYVNKDSKVFASFIEMTKAFDKVNHNILINKLCESRVSPVIVNVLHNMYSNQYVNVIFNEIKSDFWLLCNGVRQGGIISPVLFNFYIDEILKQVSTMDVGCKLNNIRHNVQGYADDLTLLAPSSYSLQLLIDKLEGMLSDLCLKANERKSVCMIFNLKHTANTCDYSFFLKGKKLEIVKSYKYLGVILSNDMSNKEDIKRMESSFLKQFYSIYRKFCNLDQKSLMFLYQAHCMSLYGCEIWDSLKGALSQFDSLAVNYHKSIKKVMHKLWIHSNHETCSEAGVPVFKHLVNMKMVSFVLNLYRSRSKCIQPYLPYLRVKSVLFNRVSKIFKNDYDIPNIFDNDLDAVKSRIIFVEAHEPRSSYYMNVM